MSTDKRGTDMGPKTSQTGGHRQMGTDNVKVRHLCPTLAPATVSHFPTRLLGRQHAASVILRP
jgi:hypothetical protein